MSKVIADAAVVIDSMREHQACSDIESLKVFYLVLQVCQYLLAGQVCREEHLTIDLMEYSSLESELILGEKCKAILETTSAVYSDDHINGS